VGVNRASTGGLRRAVRLVALAAATTLALTLASPVGSAGATTPAATAASAAAAATAAPPVLPVTGPHTMKGTARHGYLLTLVVAPYNPRATSYSYQWYRDYTPISGATAQTYRITAADVDHRLRAVVTARRAGWTDARTLSQPTPVVGDTTPRRRTVVYDVRIDGDIPGFRVDEFGVQSGETLQDPRGWRAGGTHFQRTASRAPSDFTLIIATADRLPKYAGECSVQWSCRVGRNVIINYTRWMQASPSWNAAGGSLRDYRHMVVNHEVGHFLGNGHVGCGSAGSRAPVMMQQSKGLGGCRFNPWPLPSEW